MLSYFFDIVEHSIIPYLIQNFKHAQEYAYGDWNVLQAVEWSREGALQ